MSAKTTLQNLSYTIANTLFSACSAVGAKNASTACLVTGVGLTACAQCFDNLDFELATGIPAQTGYLASVSFTQAFPGWTGYCGPVQQTGVLYDFEWLDTAGISILDFNCAFDPAAAVVTHGHYCACLYSGFRAPGPNNGDVETWLAQSGQIPANAVTLLFNYSTSASSSAWGESRVVVTFNGVTIPLSVVSVLGPGASVLGGDVSPFAGQCGELRFTAPHDCTGHCRSMFLLDYIRFSGVPTQTQFTYVVTFGTITITGYTGCGGAVVVPGSIDDLPVTVIGPGAFSQSCSHSLTSVTLPDSVTFIGYNAFRACSSLTNVTLGNSLSSIGSGAFAYCTALTSMTLPDSLASIDDAAFEGCSSLNGVYFLGDAPSLRGPSVFQYDHNIVYYLPGTSGWGPTFGGRPTALWILPPTLQLSPQTQTAEAGSAVGFFVKAAGGPVLGYQWFFNDTNRLSCANCLLELADVQSSQAGAYTVVVTNAAGSVTSAPAFLGVIPPVERRLVPALTLMGQRGSSMNLDFAAALGSAPTWATIDSVALTNSSQRYFDLSAPLSPQGFYRAWQTNGVGPPPSLNLNIVPAITLTGAVGSSLRIDYINQFGPIDAWMNLDTVILTNTSQLYFDTSSIGQPPRLWRIVPVP